MSRSTLIGSTDHPLPPAPEISCLERATRELDEVLMALDPAELTAADRNRLAVLLAQLLRLRGNRRSF